MNRLAVKNYKKTIYSIYAVCIYILLYCIYCIFNFSLHKVVAKPFPDMKPEKIPPFLLPIHSESLLVMEEHTGKILLSKNADILMPPASMTKLITLYIIYNKIRQGIVNKNTIIPIPLSAWAKMLPKDSSLMFLEPGQIVTMHELMLGLAIPSGNDAAIAVAEYLSGSVENFVKEMNNIIQSLGLKHIHFEDANGYSPNNYVTAYEFAQFAREYLRQFPESIEDIHEVKVLNFPVRHNYPSYFKGKVKTISQKNHNPLLNYLEGTEGLKTGYIGKSGFNVTVSVKRNNTRLIVVQLGSFAGTSDQANNNRVEDITKVVNYIYDNYSLYSIPQDYFIPELNINAQVMMKNYYLYHYSPIVQINKEIFPNQGYIVQGQIIGRLILKDQLGQIAYYPLIAHESKYNPSILDRLKIWCFHIWSLFQL